MKIPGHKYEKTEHFTRHCRSFVIVRPAALSAVV